MIGSTGVYWLWCEFSDAERAIASLRTTLDKMRVVPRDVHAVYGSPPRPPRPFRPTGLAGTYYRGNLERHPALFNGGNYRSATLLLSVCDAAGHELDVGSPVPSDSVVIRLEVVRAANTSDALLGDAIMSQWFVSAADLTTGAQQPLPADLVRFTPLEEGRRWVANYPLAIPQSERDGFSGNGLYVYRAPVNWTASTSSWPQCEYVIMHALGVLDGHLAPAADLWMGSVLANDYLALPQPRRIPLDEWFDDRPIPELPGAEPVDPYRPGGSEPVCRAR